MLKVTVLKAGRMGTDRGPLDLPTDGSLLMQCLEGPYSVTADGMWQKRKERKNGEAVNHM